MKNKTRKCKMCLKTFKATKAQERYGQFLNIKDSMVKEDGYVCAQCLSVYMFQKLGKNKLPWK